MRHNRPSQRGCRGFTLIELLIVVAIIGLIAAIAIPAFFDALDRSRQKSTMTDLQSGVGTAIEEYKLDNGGRAPSSGTFAALLTVLETQNYLEDPPSTDHWDNAYLYAVSADQRSYSAQSNGKDGTSGDGVLTERSRNWNCEIIFSNNRLQFGSCS